MTDDRLNRGDPQNPEGLLKQADLLPGHRQALFERLQSKSYGAQSVVILFSRISEKYRSDIANSALAEGGDPALYVALFPHQYEGMLKANVLLANGADPKKTFDLIKTRIAFPSIAANQRRILFALLRLLDDSGYADTMDQVLFKEMMDEQAARSEKPFVRREKLSDPTQPGRPGSIAPMRANGRCNNDR